MSIRVAAGRSPHPRDGSGGRACGMSVVPVLARPADTTARIGPASVGAVLSHG